MSEKRKPSGKGRWVSGHDFLRAVSAAEELELARMSASALGNPKIGEPIEDLMHPTKRSRPDSPPVTTEPGLRKKTNK